MFGNSSYRTAIFFLLTSFFFGSSFVAIEIGVKYIPPLIFAALRFIVGGGLLMLVVAVTREKWYPQSKRDLLGIAAVGIFIITVQNAALNVGIQYIPSPAAAVVFGLIPLVTAGFAELLIPEESSTVSDVFGIFIGFVGVFIVVRPSPETLFAGEMLGYFLVFIAVVGIALGSVLLQQTKPALGMLPMSAWGMLFGGCVTFVGGIGMGESVTAIEWTATSVLSLVYLSTVVAIVGYSLYFHLILKIGSHKANLLSYLDPVMAALVAWGLTGQMIAPLTAVGFVVIFLGFVVLEHRILRTELGTIYDL
jgi:probable blue pigment (indigoidine) exporter